VPTYTELLEINGFFLLPYHIYQLPKQLFKDLFYREHLEMLLETLLKVSTNLEKKHKKCEVESMFFHARTARDGPSCAVPTFRTIRHARRRT
jgi:hypothetical protein